MSADPATARRRDRTLAVTWGPWGGFGLSVGKGSSGWRVVLCFVAVAYFPFEVLALIRAGLDSIGVPSGVVSRVSAYTGTRT